MVHQVVDSEDLTAQLTEAGDKLVVIDFYETWSMPCKMMEPILGQLENSMDDVVFLKVDSICIFSPKM